MSDITSAQQYVADGFYRVQNATTSRYITVTDDYGKIDFQATKADLGAITTYSDFDEKILSNPASVIYSTYSSSGYKFDCQGTNTYDIIGTYLHVSNRNNSYQLYASKSNLVQYLNDAIETGCDSSYVETSGRASCNWYVYPISTEGDNVFGMKPTLSHGGSHYLSFYAGFPFSFHSSGMSAWYVKAIDTSAGVAIWEEITGDIPQGSPIFAKCSSTDPRKNILDIHTSTKTAPTDSKMKGVYFFSYRRQESNPHYDVVNNDTSTMRVLGILSDGSLGVKKSTELYMPKNSAYVVVPAGSPDEIKLMTQEEYDKSKVATDIPVESVSLNHSEYNIELTEASELQLVATVLPENATDRSIQWTTSDSSVATVDGNGLVTFIKAGFVTITAQAADGSGCKATCLLTATDGICQITTQDTVDRTTYDLMGRKVDYSTRLKPGIYIIGRKKVVVK